MSKTAKRLAKRFDKEPGHFKFGTFLDYWSLPPSWPLGCPRIARGWFYVPGDNHKQYFLGKSLPAIQETVNWSQRTLKP